jgi:hypothetical protein
VFRTLSVIATFAALSFVTAADPPAGHHDDHFMQCAKACDDCARSCDACTTHCAKMVADGKKDHLATLATCQDCATACQAASCVTARKGPFAGLMCTACADACKRCGDECEKFKDDPMMKACADECRKCEKACRDMVRHTAGKDEHGEKK